MPPGRNNRASLHPSDIACLADFLPATYAVELPRLTATLMSVELIALLLVWRLL